MVALDDLKSGDQMTIPWYEGKEFEFRVDGDDMVWGIVGGGTQRRINITPLRFLVGSGLLTYTIPKRGASYLTAAKELLLHPPKQGVEQLGDTFTFEELGACHRATDEMQVSFGDYTIVQRSYLMPDNKSVLLAERHIPGKRGNPSTHFYQTIGVTERELRRK